MTTILALVPDLMFGTHLQATAKHLALAVVSLVVVALDAPGALPTIVAAKDAGVRVLAFGSNKDGATLAVGADRLVARSRMAADRSNLLRGAE